MSLSASLPYPRSSSADRLMIDPVLTHNDLASKKAGRVQGNFGDHLEPKTQKLQMITIVGGVPFPRGGVTTFVFRLATRLVETACLEVEILDLYPHPSKLNIGCGVSHKTAPTNLLFRILWLIANIQNKSDIHFNFSTTKALLLFAILPKRKSRWTLTLHHGNLGNNVPGKIKSRILKSLLQRFDSIVALNESQMQFYMSAGASPSRLHRLTSYIKGPETQAKPSDKVKQLVHSVRKSGRQLIFASGYPTNTYQHIELLQAIESLQQKLPVFLLLCVYGPDSENLTASIQEKVRGIKNAQLIDSMPEDDFACILQAADLYVRANLVDSCGIAVHDSVEYGTKVVASDACERPAEAILFPAGDTAKLESAIEKALALKTLPRNSASTDSLPGYLRAYSLRPAA